MTSKAKGFFKKENKEQFFNRVFGPKTSPKDFFSAERKKPITPAEGSVLLGEKFKYSPEDSKEPIYQTQEQRDRGTYIIGKMGAGKTTLIRNMIYQDLQAGNGLGVIAPEQEMITQEILPFIPKNRIDDVIYFNPADLENPVLFNPLKLEDGQETEIAQGGDSIRVAVRITEDVPAGAAWLRSSSCTARLLGDSFGPVSIKPGGGKS